MPKCDFNTIKAFLSFQGKVKTVKNWPCILRKNLFFNFNLLNLPDESSYVRLYLLCPGGCSV